MHNSSINGIRVSHHTCCSKLVYYPVIMIEKRSLSERCIIAYLNIYYSIEVISLTPLLLGADMNASVYKAQGHESCPATDIILQKIQKFDRSR